MIAWVTEEGEEYATVTTLDSCLAADSGILTLTSTCATFCGDALLLCTDGVRHLGLIASLQQLIVPGTCAGGARYCARRCSGAGAPDNFSLIFVSHNRLQTDHFAPMSYSHSIPIQ